MLGDTLQAGGIHMETEKSTRLLYLYQDLTKGVGIQKKAAADRFGVKLVGLLCWPIKQAKQSKPLVN